MNVDDFFGTITISYNAQSNPKLLEEIQSLAINHYECAGIEEFGLSEEEVDKILGDKAFSGGEIPWEVFSAIEDFQLELNSFKYKYFFTGSDCKNKAEKFSKFIVETAHTLNSEQLFFNDISFEMNENRDWNEKWKEFFSPIIISDRIKIIPEFLKESFQSNLTNTHPNTYPIPIFIYPGMGFGTGNHETTHLCLEAIDFLLKNYSKSELEQFKILDYGTGSGILGIASKQLGIGQVVLCDIDEQALNNVIQNFKINFPIEEARNFTLIKTDSKCRYKIFESGDRAFDSNFLTNKEVFESQFDFVFANILLNTLLELRETLTLKVKDEGYLVLSGLLKGQEDEIKKSFLSINEQEVFEIVLEKSKGDWLVLVLKKVLKKVGFRGEK